MSYSYVTAFVNTSKEASWPAYINNELRGDEPCSFHSPTHIGPLQQVALLLLCVFSLHVQTGQALNFTGHYSLVERQIPQHTGKIEFRTLDETGDQFIVRDTPGSVGSVTIECSALSACSRALYK